MTKMTYKSPLIALMFIGALAVACGSNASLEETTSKGYDGPILAFQDIITEYSKKGEAKVILKAPIKYRLQNNDETYPEGIHLDVFGENGRKKTILIADSAKFINEQKLHIMMGKVKVTNIQEQQSLETSVLYWDERFKEIYTDTIVKITTTSEVINGIGMRAKQDFSQYKILRPTGVISVEEEPQI